jgi:L-threonylcarbamoyladenylate synthase
VRYTFDYKEEFRLACSIMLEGGIILYPCDTIWGLGCDSLHPGAYQRLLEIKNIPDHPPMILLVSGIEMLKCYVSKIPPRLEDLLVVYEKPLTVVYDRVRELPDHIKAADGSVAIRITREPYSRGLVEMMGRPIITTQATLNQSFMVRSFGEVQSGILEKVDFIATCNRHLPNENLPSVIIRYHEKSGMTFLRE